MRPDSTASRRWVLAALILPALAPGLAAQESVRDGKRSRAVATRGVTTAERPAPRSPARTVLGKLRGTRLGIEWSGREFTAGMQELGVLLDLNLVVSSELLDRGVEPVDLKLRAVRGDSLLRLLSRQLDVRFLVGGDVVIVTTPEDSIRRRAVLRTYDLRPALYVPPDFPGPRSFGLRPSGSFEEDPPEVERRAGPSPDDVADIVRRAIGESQWESRAVSISATHNMLIVRHTPEVHRRISRVLLLLSSH